MAKLKKNTQGYGYKYTELADINDYIESIGETYYQFVEPHENGKEYIYTVRCKDGKPIMEPLRGANITQASLSGKVNPAQQQGAGITYARRYSLLMAYGLATTDDDGAVFDTTEEEQQIEDMKKELISEQQGKELMGILKGKDAARFMADYGITRLGELTREQRVKALKELEQGKYDKAD